MPIISMFYGIRIYIYLEEGSQHNKPHIQAIYNEYQISVDFQGNILSGELTRKQQALVIALIMIHEEELKANYELIKDHQQPFRIEPLK